MSSGSYSPIARLLGIGNLSNRKIAGMAGAGFTERNKAHFDSVAPNYHDGNEKTFLRLTEEIHSRRDWLGIDLLDEDEGDGKVADERQLRADGYKERKVLRLLDYACGPGTVSRALGPYVTQTLGIDLSEEMVKAYNDRARNEGLSPDEMFATAGDLLALKNPSPAEFRDEKWFNFDLVVVCLGFHHFEDPVLAAVRLAERLRPGGVLLIIDFLPHEHPEGVGSKGDHSHGHSHGHGHHHHEHPEGVGSKGDHSHGHSHGHGHHHHHHHHAADDKPPECANEDIKKVMATVAHFGFAEEKIKETLEKAGVGKEFAFEVIAKGLGLSCHCLTTVRDVFIAKGKKA